MYKALVSWAGLLVLVFSAGPARGQGYPAEEASGKMTVPEGFTARLVAAEPVIRQPVCIEFDGRGRLWVVQYLQYPNPAGLKRVAVDRYSRTAYDRVPEPPPKGPRGADRITILDRFDESGRARRARDFLAGLNLASGIAFGHGGVFVLQPPYLLFYPDRDGDDKPDGDPDVLLTGFGMEDAHSVANSLTWGPDGWLYGCQGSTVTANIRGITFQQGVWRYHPIRRAFELFCEGGGNSWGLDFDEHGNLLYSTNVGGHVMLHGVQGGYYWKSFGKHGALHNPHAYGYFDHVPHERFTGGHVSVGGLVYRGGSFPGRFRGKYLAADLLGHALYWHTLSADGGSFRSAHGGSLLQANDTWFAPSDMTLGPDGSIYVADWHDRRTAHPDPDADWDRRNGRVFKIEAEGTPPVEPFDLSRLPRERLLDLLGHRNVWFRRQARRVLADRRDPEVIFPLRRWVREEKNEGMQLEALWALYVSGGFTDGFAAEALAHDNPHVRRWAVRFLGDERKVSGGLARKLIALAEGEESAVVRSQLACSARRLPAEVCLPIVGRLLRRDADAKDPHIPLLLWWAVEEHAVAARGEVLGMFATPAAWERPLARDVIQGRLMRRYAAEGAREGYLACARLLASAPQSERGRMLAALDQGLQDRPSGDGKSLGTLFADQAAVTGSPEVQAPRVEEVPPQLKEQVAALWREDTTDVTLIRLAMRLGLPVGQERALGLVSDSRVSPAVRVGLLQALGEVGPPSCVGPLLDLVGGGEPEAVQVAALSALERFEDGEIPRALLAGYAKMSANLRARASQALLSRKGWARALLAEVDGGRIAAKEIPVEQLRVVALHRDEALDALVRKHWGSIGAGTPEEKLAEMRRLNNDLRAADGHAAAGHPLFTKHCATCHKLHGEGGSVGPDLTHANRKDRNYLLASLVDPSAVIRKEYLSYTVETTDGRVLAGLIAEETPGGIVLVDAKAQRTEVSRGKIASAEASPTSLMPEGLLKELSPQELRDLFAFLQADGPPRRETP